MRTDTVRWVEDSGRACLPLVGDIAEAAHCRAIIDQTVKRFGRIDILVNNAAHQETFDSLGDIPDEEWQCTFAVNIHAMFYPAKAAVPHMAPGSSRVDQCGHAESFASGLCHNKRRDPEFHRRLGADAG